MPGQHAHALCMLDPDSPAVEDSMRNCKKPGRLKGNIIGSPGVADPVYPNIYFSKKTREYHGQFIRPSVATCHPADPRAGRSGTGILLLFLCLARQKPLRKSFAPATGPKQAVGLTRGTVSNGAEA